MREFLAALDARRGVIDVVSPSSGAHQEPRTSYNPTISANGRRIAYVAKDIEADPAAAAELRAVDAQVPVGTLGQPRDGLSEPVEQRPDIATTPGGGRLQIGRQLHREELDHECRASAVRRQLPPRAQRFR